ncbi:hypothetical protein SAY87_022661 [Trapa incisa]|uniref:Uncharacterized protein n=1 Tax=Trapa incisa TaxID=236973 RepID=A0AAN7Q9J3_9MYRT|nr:hypothetical protein SAY87_022661 [Trapa incisa]
MPGSKLKQLHKLILLGAEKPALHYNSSSSARWMKPYSVTFLEEALVMSKKKSWLCDDEFWPSDHILLMRLIGRTAHARRPHVNWEIVDLTRDTGFQAGGF